MLWKEPFGRYTHTPQQHPSLAYCSPRVYAWASIVARAKRLGGNKQVMAPAQWSGQVCCMLRPFCHRFLWGGITGRLLPSAGTPAATAIYRAPATKTDSVLKSAAAAAFPRKKEKEQTCWPTTLRSALLWAHNIPVGETMTLWCHDIILRWAFSVCGHRQVAPCYSVCSSQTPRSKCNGYGNRPRGRNCPLKNAGNKIIFHLVVPKSPEWAWVGGQKIGIGRLINQVLKIILFCWF